MNDVAQVEIAPVEASRRIKTLDVLRGLAILGILAVNAPFFAAPWQTAMNPSLAPLAIDPSNAWSWFVPHVFFEAKFITLFSLLFGVSIFLVGAERSDKGRGKVLRRRLGWMLLFGIVHGAAIWFGDILLVYAVSGFIVMLARSWKPRTLMIVGSTVYVLLAAFGFLAGAAIGMAPAEVLEEMRTEMWSPPLDVLNATVSNFSGTFVQSLAANFTAWSDFVPYELSNTVPRSIAVMMIGLALFKWGFFSGNTPVWAYLIVIGVGAAALAAVAYQAQLNYAAGFDFIHMNSRGAMLNPALSILITLMYASLLILCVKLNVLGFLTNALAPVGQMAFTNYISQSVIMTAIFYGGRGLGLYGEVSREGLVAIVAGIWVLQLIWSPLWLSRFSMGPLEWVWRRLSYGKPVAIGKAVPA
ncbi:DUF418 domain-containing protein [Candidatus Viadribacter manganicus]|uniref:DUF418 domain-containing protein n=1 Tax=Candidatus Viadribacter manganicus TaxID=1759059 RepID=A0A1B1AF06_9PROT|nr:DUF418 domain-containing protein [Candidatus Viadribacter manganicus]ANP45156.1 hypothetical protein ATE48_04110 [Candidatus Viadribacter manganicus]